MKYALVAMLLAASTVGPRISIYPQVLFAGGALRLRCSVPPAPANRWLDFGVQDYRTSGEELDGEKAVVTHETIIDHIPCNVGPAFCAVTDANGKVRTVTAAYEMAGCEP